MRTLRVKKKSVKKSFQNSIRLLVALLMMAGALSAYAYDAAGTTADRATTAKITLIAKVCKTNVKNDEKLNTKP